jgi:DnaJ-class molecular chaperone
MTEHEIGTDRDICSKCGGYVSLGHAAGSSCQSKKYYCLTCYGDGKITEKNITIKCPDCNGIGIEKSNAQS